MRGTVSQKSLKMYRNIASIVVGLKMNLFCRIKILNIVQALPPQTGINIAQRGLTRVPARTASHVPHSTRTTIMYSII